MEELHYVDACREEHFQAMSRIHALGWQDTYAGVLPAEYLEKEITLGRWTPVFRENYRRHNGVQGLLLYRGEEPVSCLNYCRARVTNYNVGDLCTFDNRGYEDWGEVASFYTLPGERGKGYGGLLFEQALRRLKESGFARVFVFVLGENEKARRFYAAHGFTWDGTHADIPFPGGTVCRDLRYVRELP